jgi:hypothetical protein
MPLLLMMNTTFSLYQGFKTEPGGSFAAGGAPLVHRATKEW